MGVSIRSVGQLAGTKVLEGALRKWDSDRRIGDEDLPRGGTLSACLGVAWSGDRGGLCDGVDNIELAGLLGLRFLDDRLSGMLDRVLLASGSAHCCRGDFPIYPNMIANQREIRVK